MERLSEEINYKHFSDVIEHEFSKPKYWSNNKRRLHHLPMRRKQGKKNRRYYWYRKHQKEMFDLIEDCLDRALGKYNTEFFGTFVDCKEIK